MKKRTFLFVSMAIALSSSMQSHASGLPTIDIPKWGAWLNSRIQQMKEFKEDMQMKEDKAELDAEIAAEKIDAFNNGSSNYIVRKTQGMTDLFNLKQALSSLPTQMACEQLSVKADIDTLLCDSQKQLSSYQEESQSIDDPLTAAQRQENGKENTLAKSYGYSDYDNDGDIDSLDAKRAVIKRSHDQPDHMYEAISSLVSFSDAHITLSPDQLQSAKDAVLTLAPEYEERETLYGDTPEGVSARLRVEREKAFRNSVFNTYNTLLSKKASTNPDEYGPSVLHSQRLQSDNFYNDNDFENTIAFKASTSNVASPAQMYRYLATAYAMKNDQAFRRYEQSLRDESLQAQKLILLQESM